MARRIVHFYNDSRDVAAVLHPASCNDWIKYRDNLDRRDAWWREYQSENEARRVAQSHARQLRKRVKDCSRCAP